MGLCLTSALVKPCAITSRPCFNLALQTKGREVNPFVA
jgi:hypothetical protein